MLDVTHFDKPRGGRGEAKSVLHVGYGTHEKPARFVDRNSNVCCCVNSSEHLMMWDTFPFLINSILGYRIL